MKRTSWEMVVAGLIFLIVGIILLNNNPEEDHNAGNTEVRTTVTINNNPATSSAITVLDLKSLEPSNLKVLTDLIADSQYTGALMQLSAILKQLPDTTDINAKQKLEAIDSILTNVEVIRSISVNKDQSIRIDGSESAPGNQWRESLPGIYEWHKVLVGANISQITTNLPVGNITVTVSDSDQATLILKASGSIDNSDDLAKRFTTLFADNNGNIRLELSKNSTSGTGDIQLEAILSLPVDTEIAASTGGGHIDISGIQADQTLETGGGHIRISGVNGDVVAVTKGGHITISESEGEVIMKTGGGHLLASDHAGNINSSTSGGNITIQRVEGEITTSTKGGNISIELDRLTQDIHADAEAGNIAITLPGSSRFNAELKGSNVLNISGFNFEEMIREEDHLNATMPGSDVMIRAYTRFGSITIDADG